MSLSLILGCIWVLAAALTAMLPMKRQYPPGIVLLIAAPLLMGFIAWQHGVVWLLIAILAFLSMFRRPLMGVIKYLRRKYVEQAE